MFPLYLDVFNLSYKNFRVLFFWFFLEVTEEEAGEASSRGVGCGGYFPPISFTLSNVVRIYHSVRYGSLITHIQ